MQNPNNPLPQSHHDSSNDGINHLHSNKPNDMSIMSSVSSQESSFHQANNNSNNSNYTNQETNDPASTSNDQSVLTARPILGANQYFKPITINIKATRKEKALFEMFLKHFESSLRFTDHDFNLKLAAREIGTNEKYISSAINKCTGMSFNKIVNQYRVEYAKKLIYDDILTHHNLEEIAYMAGYGNRTTFYRVFTELVGITPSRFRDNLNRGIEM